MALIWDLRKESAGFGVTTQCCVSAVLSDPSSGCHPAECTCAQSSVREVSDPFLAALVLSAPVSTELLSVLLLMGYKSPTTQSTSSWTFKGGLKAASGAGGCWDGDMRASRCSDGFQCLPGTALLVW